MITSQNAVQLNAVVVDMIEGMAEAADKKEQKKGYQPRTMHRISPGIE